MQKRCNENKGMIETDTIHRNNSSTSSPREKFFWFSHEPISVKVKFFRACPTINKSRAVRSRPKNNVTCNFVSVAKFLRASLRRKRRKATYFRNAVRRDGWTGRAEKEERRRATELKINQPRKQPFRATLSPPFSSSKWAKRHLSISLFQLKLHWEWRKNKYVGFLVRFY